MPSAAARRLYEDQIPSFMSVFDLDAETMADRETVTLVDPKLMELEEPLCANHRTRPGTLPPDVRHRLDDSTSTQNTESADSSPTTTLSTADSASLSDPSPSSSPDSPITQIPISSYSSAAFSSLNGSMAAVPPSLAPPPFTNMSTMERPVTSPSPRKPRNMKGLSIQPISLNNTLASEPSSPSFIKPKIPAMKRKPSQLSLKTDSSDLNLRQSSQLEVPQSPGIAPILQRRALKHSTSSPHMLSGLKSATFGPAGGMSFPPVFERNDNGLSTVLRPSKSRPGLGSFDSTIAEEESPIKAQVANRAALDFEPFRESENEDQKSPGYPDGPICIYDPNVYLYLEPTAEEAMRFDVVINVAREVSNPFGTLGGPARRHTDAEHALDPDAAVDGPTEAGFAVDAVLDSPTTPKASKMPPLQEPEYIHIPWDHNTDIQADLMHLCEVIEKRSKEGKKILVHCQQGASRSASLIIAFGIFQNPELTVNDAYYAAQARSKWISPNMRLMYCLQDFQKEVSKKRLSPGATYKSRSGRSPTKHHRLTLSADNIDISPKEPLTAPLPSDEENLVGSDHANDNNRSITSPGRLRGHGAPCKSDPVSPGPSSAPSSFSWAEKEDKKDPGRYGRFNMKHLVPPSTTRSDPDGSLTDASSLFRRLPERPHISNSPSHDTGFAPLQLDLPPSSPGFCSFDDILKPLPSPGLDAHGYSKPGSWAPGFFGIEQRQGSKPRNTGTPDGQDTRSQQEAECRPMPAKFSSDTPRQMANYAPRTVDLPMREWNVPVARAQADDLAVMSPRAEAMTRNPLHQSSSEDGAVVGMRFAEVPPTPEATVFSPRQTMFPRDPFYPFGRPTQMIDPRSPPTKSETPIVRSIDEML